MTTMRDHMFTSRCGCGAILRDLEPCARCVGKARALVTDARDHEPLLLGTRGAPAADPERCGCGVCMALRGLKS